VWLLATAAPAQLQVPKEVIIERERTIRDWLRENPEAKCYAVVLGITMKHDGSLINLRVSRVTAPRHTNDTQPLDVEVPESYLNAARKLVAKAKFRPKSEHGLPSEFYTYYFYMPDYPKVVITDLDNPMAELVMDSETAEAESAKEPPRAPAATDPELAPPTG